MECKSRLYCNPEKTYSTNHVISDDETRKINYKQAGENNKSVKTKWNNYMRIYIAQIEPIKGDIQKNLGKHLKFITAALAKRPDLIMKYVSV